MTVKIFYSWQSETKSSANRGFIHDALLKAADLLEEEGIVEERPEIDQGTFGLPGSPDIANSILSKIDQSTIFVGDVTIANSQHKLTRDHPCDCRLSPNANVLIELGYALKSLGQERIIMIQNLHYGDGPLPFDLRTKRALGYSLHPDEKDKKKPRDALVKILVNALSSITKHLELSGATQSSILEASRESSLRDFHHTRIEFDLNEFQRPALYAHASIVIHLLPQGCLLGEDFEEFTTWGDALPVIPFDRMSSRGRHNLEGYEIISQDDTDDDISRIQVFRDGAIESYSTIGRDYHGKDVISAVTFENTLISHLVDLSVVIERLGRPLNNALLNISLINLADTYWGTRHPHLPNQPFPHQILQLPQIKIERPSERESVQEALRPILNRIWQASGHQGSPRYRPTP